MTIQKIFIVEYEKQIIGIWDSYESAKTFIMGCHQNRLMISVANIKTYQINTCFCLETTSIKYTIEQSSILNNNQKSKDFLEIKPTIQIKKLNIDTESSAYMEITKQKKELQTITILQEIRDYLKIIIDKI